MPRLRSTGLHFSSSSGRDLGSLAIAGVVGDLRLELLVDVAGEEQDDGAEVLVEIRRVDERGERAALGAVGREEDDFAIAAFDVGGEDGGDAAAGDGLAEDQVAVGEVEADVLLDEA